MSNNTGIAAVFTARRRRAKYELKERLENLNRSYERAVEEKRLADARDAYYATSEGAAHKARLEKAIEQKIAEREDLRRLTIEAIENSLRQLMGVHWGVKRFDSGYLEIRGHRRREEYVGAARVLLRT